MTDNPSRHHAQKAMDAARPFFSENQRRHALIAILGLTSEKTFRHDHHGELKRFKIKTPAGKDISAGFIRLLIGYRLLKPIPRPGCPLPGEFNAEGKMALGQVRLTSHGAKLLKKGDYRCLPDEKKKVAAIIRKKKEIQRKKTATKTPPPKK